MPFSIQYKFHTNDNNGVVVIYGAETSQIRMLIVALYLRLSHTRVSGTEGSRQPFLCTALASHSQQRLLSILGNHFMVTNTVISNIAQ